MGRFMHGPPGWASERRETAIDRSHSGKERPNTTETQSICWYRTREEFRKNTKGSVPVSVEATLSFVE